MGQIAIDLVVLVLDLQESKIKTKTVLRSIRPKSRLILQEQGQYHDQ